MSTVRRDTAAARAAQARRRQRATTSNSSSQAPPTRSNQSTTTTSGTPAPLPSNRTRPLSSHPAATTAAPMAPGIPKEPTTTTDSLPTSSRRRETTTPRRTNKESSPHPSSSSSSRTRPPPSRVPPTASSVRPLEPHSPHPPPQAPAVEEEPPLVEEIQEEEEEFNDAEPPLVGPDRLDAACLEDGALVRIRALSQPSTCLTLPCSSEPSSSHPSTNTSTTTTAASARLVTTTGRGLSEPEEVFQLVHVRGYSSNDTIIRYGDSVLVRSTVAPRRVLGVRKSQTENVTTHQIGCFRKSKADTWTLKSPSQLVQVGRDATPQVSSEKTKAVQSGHVVVLRHDATGGLLSLDSVVEGQLTLTTHSYNSSSSKQRNADKGLLERLQQHDRLWPDPQDQFQLVLASTPPCPLWAASQQDIVPTKRDAVQFGPLASCDALAPQVIGLSREVFSQQTVQLQEQMLLDQVLGSLLGLVGTHILISVKDHQKAFVVKSQSNETTTPLEPSVVHCMERILCLSTYYMRVRDFIARRLPGYEYGCVLQALVHAMEGLLQDYREWVAQLDQRYRSRHGKDPTKNHLTMNRLYVEIQTPLTQMSVLHDVTVAVSDKKGGALLNALRRLQVQVLAGNAVAQEILEPLIQQAAVPYVNMLNGWLTEGVLQDPVEEFMIGHRFPNTARGSSGAVRSGAAGYDGDVWNDMCWIRQDHVLEGVLSPELVHKILMTGRYWNAVRYCQPEQQQQRGQGSSGEESSLSSSSLLGEPTTEPNLVSYGMDLVSLSSFIDRVYHSASSTLLRLLLNDCRLSETLLTMKRFFLLDQGDFLVHFLDSAEDELLQEVEDVSLGRIQNWLAISVQLTSLSGGGDDHSHSSSTHAKSALAGGPLEAQSLRCGFALGSLVDRLDELHTDSGGIDARVPKTPSRHPYGAAPEGLTGIEAFALDFQAIPFPTSLVVSLRSLGSYQLLFRHIFFAKHVERRLVGIWLDHQMMKQLQSIRGALGPTYCLRQRMLHFMQNFIYYMMSEVMEPNWTKMMQAIEATGDDDTAKQGVRTVDDIIELHTEFLRRTCEECLLTNRRLVRILAKLMSTCLLFSDQMKRFMKESKIVEENNLVANMKRSDIQRNLNDPDAFRISKSKKLMRKKMTEEKEERERRLQLQAARVERELSNDSYKRMIARYEEVFTEDLRDFMHHLQSGADDQYHSHRVNLCMRLDYNGYVAQRGRT